MSRVSEGHCPEFQRTRWCLGLLAMVIDGQWRVQSGPQAAPGSTTPLNQGQHPASGKHRPDQLPQVHAESRQSADGQGSLPNQHSTQSKGEHRGADQRDTHGRLKRCLPALRLQAGMGCVFGQFGKARGTSLFQAQCTQGTHTGDSLLHMVVELAKTLE